MELEEILIAEIITADFEENTITFQIDGDFKVTAGKYIIQKLNTN
jgi:hypothetical protein